MTTVLMVGAWLAYSFIGGYWWRRFAWEFKQDWINSRGEALFFGLLKATVWPAALLWRAATSSDAFMLAPPQVRQKEREEIMRGRIAELERELGIGQGDSR